ncbi:MAG: transglycosylase SLT domain-containing protein [Gemmatimonadaceae bacterium]
MADLGSEQRQSGAGDPFTNVAVRRPPKPPPPRWQRILKAALHGIGAAVLLAAGTIWTIRQQHPKFVRPGELLRLPPALVSAAAPGTEKYTPPTDEKTKLEIARVQYALLKYTKDTARAQQIADAVVTQGSRKNISPALLVGILLTEDIKLRPTAQSFVGARGLMQVMPFHQGKWKECGSGSLYEIDTNVCYGVSILADLIKRSPSVERALLRYNGCVRGTNTPHCHTYSGKVLAFAEQAATRMLTFSMSE